MKIRSNESREKGSLPAFVSIVVVNWNGKKYVEACLESCGHLSYPNYEIIMVDNDSTDGSAEMVERHFPDVRLIRAGSNLGFARAINKGMLAAKGEYIAALANDICVDSMWLTYLVDALADCTGVAGGLIYFRDVPELIWGGSGMIDWTTGTVYQPCAFRKSMQHISHVDWVTGGAMLIKRELLERIGLLDEAYYLYNEDVDFCLRASRAGYDVITVSSAKSWHTTPVHQMWSERAYYLNACSKIRLYFKNFPFRCLVLILAFQLVLRPLFEVFRFGARPNFLLLNMCALKVNLYRLRETFAARKNVEMLGNWKKCSRLKDSIVTALECLRGKRYYRW